MDGANLLLGSIVVIDSRPDAVLMSASQSCADVVCRVGAKVPVLRWHFYGLLTFRVSNVSEIPQALPEHQEVDQTADDNVDEVEIVRSTAAAAAAAPNHLGRRSSSRASSRASRSRATSASNIPTGEPKDKDDLIKRGVQSFIAPYASGKVLRKYYPAHNGLTATVVGQLLEDHEDSDPSIGMLINALPKEFFRAAQICRIVDWFAICWRDYEHGRCSTFLYER